MQQETISSFDVIFSLIFLFTLIFLSIMVGVFASTKGRSRVAFFFLSLILSPLVSFIAALIITPINDGKKVAKNDGVKKCPYCAELVKEEAIVCKHCRRDI